MTAELLNELKVILGRDYDYYNAIINSKEFYFKYGKEALGLFVEFQINEEQKVYLLNNKRNYQSLKSDFETKEEYKEFGRLVFSIVSYCDENASRKVEFNRYDDNRTLAKAGLYMTDWVSSLIDYKFGYELYDGVVKNALNYLLDPEDNFPMLSENHRKQLVTNLFKKNYYPLRFKDDVREFFTPLGLNPVNPNNYSIILTSLCYAFKHLWTDSIIGLISPDGTSWRQDAVDELTDDGYIALWNHRKPVGGDSTLNLLKDCINDHGHFRIFYTSHKQVHYIAEIVAFAKNQDELDGLNNKFDSGKIAWFHQNFSDYKDENGKNARWVYFAKNFSKVNPNDYSDFKFYKTQGYPSVGNQAPIISLTERENLDVNNKIKKMLSLLEHKKQIILQGPPGTGKTKMAKEIAAELLGVQSPKALNDNNQYAIIQFHPSYTYEDFVRGITARPNAENGKEGIVYEAENRILEEFAKRALENYWGAINLDVFQKSENRFKNFVNHVIERISEKERYMISENIYIDFVGDNRFKYKGDNWKAHPDGLNMNFSEIEKILSLNLKSRQEISKNETLNALTRQHATYFQNVIEKINELSQVEPSIDQARQPLKNYVLVIDEINRANLSAVLGELIYGLEYRGDKVKSMYAINGDNGIILPPNLYIIGTMNTADRSVGHIDYAIRRRFAFVEVLPENLSNELKDEFKMSLFEIVSKLFIEDYKIDVDYKANPQLLIGSHYLTNDFKPQDVWLGHSYFIQQYEKGLNGEDDKNKPIDFSERVKYEILPILKEYVKDGILKEDAMTIINDLESKINA